MGKNYELEVDLLNDEQKIAAELAIKYVKGETDFLSLLISGYAGTGKTYTISKIIKYLVGRLHLKVIVTAPTNKAVKILEQSSDVVHPSIQYMTCHKMLGLKPYYDNWGKLKFKQGSGEDDKSPLDKRTVVIVDETSMFPDDLFEFLYPEINDAGIKLIFLGDSAQIPPVNKLDCIPFQVHMRERHSIGMTELTKIVRQAETNPILAMATQIRSNISSTESFRPKKSIIHDGSGIIVLPKANQEVIRQICDHYFVNDHFFMNPDFMKVIAWRNEVVNAVNDVVRKLIYKRDFLPKIVPSDKLIADAPVLDPTGLVQGKKWIIINTNDELEVLEAAVKTTRHLGIEINYYETKVAYVDMEGKNKEKMINIVHEDSEAAFAKILDSLKKIAVKCPPNEKGWKWKEYYEMKEHFAEIKYNYAITAHKAQGSTYDNCMVIDWDLSQNPTVIERNRIRYVAITRPRKLLFMVHDDRTTGPINR